MYIFKKPVDVELTVVVVDDNGTPHVEIIQNNEKAKKEIIGRDFDVEFPATAKIAILHSRENKKKLIFGLEIESGRLVSLEKKQAEKIAERVRRFA